MLNVEIMKFGKSECAGVTSLDVAETFEKSHNHVIRDTEKLLSPESGLSKEFNASSFGRITYQDSRGRTQPAYIMTRDGFTLLVMGYTGELAMKFKEAYIKQFNAMEKALRGKLIEREKGIAVRQALTKAIQQSAENERMHGHAYSTYTNCIYKSLFGMNAEQLRTKYGVRENDNLRDYFSKEDLYNVESMERLVSGLVDLGWGYDRIKEFTQSNNLRRLTV